MQSRFFSRPDGPKLHYLQAGDPTGTLLICLHGLGGSTATYTPIVHRLPQDHNILLLDFPGFGKSPPPSQRPTIPGLVSDLQYVIESLRTIPQGVGADQSANQKIVIIGHSLGTVVALHFAAQNPSLVAGMVLLGAARSASHIPFVRQRMLDMAANTRQHGIKWAAELASTSNFPAADKRTVEEARRKEVGSQVAGSDAETYASTCEMIVSEAHRDPDYGAITCPVVLVAGDLDVISPVERSTGIVKLLGSNKASWAEAVMSGHQLILEDAEGVVGAVERLLQAVTSA